MEDSVDRNLGNYQIVKEAERRRMVAVRGAFDRELQRIVALKVLPEYFGGDPTLIKPFRQEAVHAAKLDQPTIIAVCDVGEDEGLDYSAVQCVDSQRSSNKMVTRWF